MADCDSNWTCPICSNPLKTPIVTPCGHTFCWPCISAHLETSTECPVCHKPLKREEVVPIYGQTGEENTDDFPPPPKPERVEAKNNADDNVFGDFAFQFGTFGLGGLGANFVYQRNNRGQNHHQMNITFNLIIFVIMILVSLLSGF